MDENIPSIEDWEAFCEYGRTRAAEIDKGRWELGELASRVEKRYVQDMLGKFAMQINVSKSRIKQYRRFRAFYPKDTYVTFSQEYPTISYSHMREAMRLGAVERACQFLMECVDNDWVVEAASLELNRRLGKPLPPEKLLEAHGRIQYISIEPGQHPMAVLVLDQGVDIFALQRCQGMMAQVVVLKEESKEETSVSSPVAPAAA